MIKRFKIVFILLAVLLLSGCATRTVDELYCLPKRPEIYKNLQSAIDEEMGDRQYCAPLNGENLQTVQIADLDGDGVSEYLLFSKGSSDKPLQILIFCEEGESYVLSDTIQSAGAAFDVVEYARVDDRPGYELIVGYQVSEQVQRSVSIYSFNKGKARVLLNTNYSKFVSCDLNADGRTGLLILHPGENGEQNGVAEVYACINGTMQRSNQASMSEPVEKTKRIITGKLHGGAPAVYVASAVDETAIITDVFALDGDRFLNVNFSNGSGTSVQTLRNYYVYADDIDEDGIVELPDLLNMHIPIETNAVGMHHLIRWYAMTSTGEEIAKQYTFHDFQGGWYLTLNKDWAHRIAVVQQGNSYVFYLWDQIFQSYQELMSVYILSGDDREEQAAAEDRFELARTDNVIYAASLQPVAQECGINQSNLDNSFSLIRQEWKNGET